MINQSYIRGPAVYAGLRLRIIETDISAVRCGSEKDYHIYAGTQLTWPDGRCGSFEDVTRSNATKV